MKYDSIHKQYQLGGLYFMLIEGHHSHPNGWLCKSNIPAIDYKKLKATDKDAAIAEAIAIVKNGLELKKELNVIELRQIIFDTARDYFSPENRYIRMKKRKESEIIRQNIIRQNIINQQKRKIMKTAKLLMTIVILAIVVYTSFQFDNLTYLGWGVVCLLVGVFLAVLWNLKKVKN